MAHLIVGVYRRYLEPVPCDSVGKPLPKSDWPKKRQHCWVARWSDAGNKRYSRSFGTKGEARRFAEEKQMQLRRAYQREGCSVTLREFYEEHGKVMPGNVADNTLKLHLSTWRSFATFLGWDSFVHDISSRDIESFRAARLATPIAPATANREKQTLERLFNLAIMRGYRDDGSNPCAGLPKLRVGAVRIRVMSPEAFAKVYSTAPDSYWRALLTTLYTTGLRLREAMNVTWSDLDLKEGRLTVTRKRATDFVQAWSPKDHELRTIPLPLQTIDLLQAWRTMAPEGCPYVFMEPARWQYYHNSVKSGKWRCGCDLVHNLLARFQELCRVAETGHYTLHDLRRSCITHWAKSLPMHVVQQLAGHSDMQTTRRYYLLVQPRDLRLASRTQEALLDGVLALHMAEPNLHGNVPQDLPLGSCERHHATHLVPPPL